MIRIKSTACVLNLSCFCLIAAVLVLASPVQSGEIDESQQNWLTHYGKQANVPQPEQMLINTDPEPTVTDEYVLLFNGKDLEGWKSRGGESPFEVVDGCIVSTCKPNSPSTYLCTEKSDYADFVLTFETKFDVETNSGIMLRAQAKGQDGNTVFGPQTEMEPDSQDREWSGGIYGQSCGGWFYPLWLKEHAAVRKAQKKDDWNRVTISAQGGVIKTWLNGVPAAHWVTDTYLQGFFGLQMHKGAKGRVLWRNLKLKAMLSTHAQ